MAKSPVTRTSEAASWPACVAHDPGQLHLRGAVDGGERAPSDGHDSSGRISTIGQPGHVRTMRRASSRSATSISVYPLTTSLPSTKGPSVTTGSSPVETDGGGGVGGLELAAPADLVGVIDEPLAGEAEGTVVVGLAQGLQVPLELLGLDEEQDVLHPLAPYVGASPYMALIRRIISSGATSSTWLAMVQPCPKGSMTKPSRSP